MYDSATALVINTLHRHPPSPESLPLHAPLRLDPCGAYQMPLFWFELINLALTWEPQSTSPEDRDIGMCPGPALPSACPPPWSSHGAPAVLDLCIINSTVSVLVWSLVEPWLSSVALPNKCYLTKSQPNRRTKELKKIIVSCNPRIYYKN